MKTTPSVMIVTGIFPPDIGGPATYVPFIALEMSKRGHKVKVITSSEPQDMSQCSDYPFEVLRIPRRINKLRRTALLIWAIIKEGRNSDVLFINGFHVEAAIANLVLRKPCVMKVVGDFAWEASYGRWTELGLLDFQKKRQSLFLETIKKAREWSVSKADLVIVPSHFLREVVLGWGVEPERCRVVYNAPANNETAMEEGERREDTEGALRVISVGRLVPVKNFQKAILAVARVPGVRMTIVGEGPLQEDIAAQIEELDLGERVRLIGKMPPGEVRRLLRAHDVMLLVSSYEGFPHVIVEAMSEGLVVVATAVGGIPEVIHDGKNGMLVEPEVESIAGALSELADKPALLRDFSSFAVRDVRVRFSAEAMISGTICLLQESICMRRRKGRAASI